MSVIGYQYRIDGGAWVNAAGPTVSLTGLDSNTTYQFETRSRDSGGNFSPITNRFYATTPHVLSALVDDNGDAILDENGDLIMVWA